MNNNKKYFPVYKGTLADARKELIEKFQKQISCLIASLFFFVNISQFYHLKFYI